MPNKNNQPNPVITYLQEAEELLADIEMSALQLETDSSDNETVNRLFRAFHTIKGSGAMFGFTEVAAFTHHVETMLDLVRSHRVPATPQLSNILLAAADHIKYLFQPEKSRQPLEDGALEGLLQKIQQFSAGSSAADGAEEPVGSSRIADHVFQSGVWTIDFRPHPKMLANGANPLLLFRDLKRLGECVIHGYSEGVPELSAMDPEVCYLRWVIQLTAKVTEEAIRDVFLFVEEGSDLRIVPVAGKPVKEEPQSGAKSAAENQTGQTQTKEATVRVPAERLDRLVNLVGELVMNHSRLATAVSRFHLPELAAPVEEIERLVSELRDDVLQIRMMPIGSIFGRFRRLVHDLSRQLDKKIELVTEGEDTELDKSILDQLGEPLVHLIRNSIDHGIESVPERLAKGKPAVGTIRLVAEHRASDVILRIEDDGKGLDHVAIRAKAVSKQLIAPDANLSDKETFNLILLPGFSTAQTVTDISGRGVGMDVVKRQIDALRGNLSITSETGRGACISLTLPLTLAIIEGLLVKSGETQYIIPMPAVTENVELPLNEREHNNGRNVIAVRGELIPYIDLREVFHIEGAPPPISKIVLVRYEEHRIGLVVDRVLGTHQTVIQPMGRFFRKIQVVSGSTVMGDGRVALILDVAGIVRHAERQNAAQSLVAA